MTGAWDRGRDLIVVSLPAVTEMEERMRQWPRLGIEAMALLPCHCQ